jgi:hypothetical protein
VKGHKRCGLSVALDGSEDHLITREARLFWLEANMPDERRRAVEQVNELVASCQIASFSEWRQLVQHPEDPGVVEDEGAEFEGDLEADEVLWFDDDVDQPLVAADSEAVRNLDEEVVIEAAAGDDPVEVVDANVALRRLATLKRLRADAVAARLPAAANLVQREESQLERGLRAKSKETKEVNTVLRRHLEAAMSAEMAVVKKKREAATVEAAKRRRLAAIKTKEAARKRADKAEKDDRKKKLDALPKTITAKDCSQTGTKGFKCRVQLLERLMNGSPPLPLEYKVRWPEVRDAFASAVAKPPPGLAPKDKKKWAPGAAFIVQVNDVLKQLGNCYKGPSRFKGDAVESDHRAFRRFYRDVMEKTIPKAATFCTL